MTATTKLYPFSIQKHAHDIEFYDNRLFNTMREMESGEIPMDEVRYNKISAMYDGPLADLRDVIYGFNDGKVVFLTGAQIGLAKKIVDWARSERISHASEKSLDRYGKYF